MIYHRFLPYIYIYISEKVCMSLIFTAYKYIKWICNHVYNIANGHIKRSSYGDAYVLTQRFVFTFWSFILISAKLKLRIYI